MSFGAAREHRELRGALLTQPVVLALRSTHCSRNRRALRRSAGAAWGHSGPLTTDPRPRIKQWQLGQVTPAAADQRRQHEGPQRHKARTAADPKIGVHGSGNDLTMAEEVCKLPLLMGFEFKARASKPLRRIRIDLLMNF